MNLDEFFDFLKCTPRTWLLDKDGNIRNGPFPSREAQFFKDEHLDYIYPLCPLTAVYSFKTGTLSKMGSSEWREAGEFLGWTEDESDLISDAADRINDYDPVIRARLLDACGLRELE